MKIWYVNFVMNIRGVLCCINLTIRRLMGIFGGRIVGSIWMSCNVLSICVVVI